MTGAARGNTGDQPLSVSSADGGDPYGGAPRLKPRTGLRRFGFDAASGLAAADSMGTPLSGFADAYVGASKAEADQTAAERTATIDASNRLQEQQRYAESQARLSRNDAADNAERAARTDLLKAQAAHGGFAGRGLDQAKYYDLLIRKEVELNQKYGLNNPNLSAHDPRRAELQAQVKSDMDSFRTELQQSMGGGGGSGSSTSDGGITQSEAGDIALQSGETPLAAGQSGGEAAPAAKTKPASGAIPDNISGDGSLRDPYRVKNPKDPTIKAKIKVGDHFVYLNPKSGKEEIRIRDR